MTATTTTGTDGTTTYARAADAKPFVLGDNLNSDDKQLVTITMLANGVYKISNVRADLNIEVVATLVDSTKSDSIASHNLSVDYVKNYAYDASTAKGVKFQGTAAVSLDLYDAVASADSKGTLSMNGTYYRVDSDNIRVYGKISTKNADLSATSYVDLVNDQRFVGSVKKTTNELKSGTWTYTGAMDLTVELTDDNLDTTNKAEASGEILSGSVYDLVITLPTDAAGTDATKMYYFYA